MSVKSAGTEAATPTSLIYSSQGSIVRPSKSAFFLPSHATWSAGTFKEIDDEELDLLEDVLVVMWVWFAFVEILELRKKQWKTKFRERAMSSTARIKEWVEDNTLERNNRVEAESSPEEESSQEEEKGSQESEGSQEEESSRRKESSQEDVPAGKHNCLAGLTFVFTGQLPHLGREQAQSLVKHYGGKVRDAPSKMTSYMVLGEDVAQKKLETIKAHGLKVIDKDGLFELIRSLPANGGDSAAADKNAEKKTEEEDEHIREAGEEMVKAASTDIFAENVKQFLHNTREKISELQNSREKPEPYRPTRKRKNDDAKDSEAAQSPPSAKRQRQSSKYAPPSKYAHLPKLVDILEPNLICVFVGFNPGVRTATAGHAYAHPSNLFWKLLHSSGCTDVRLRPEQDVDLPKLYSMGNTNIVDRPSKDAAELSKKEMAAGTPILEEKIRVFRPEAICIVGKGIWEAIWRWRYKREIKKDEFHYGWQAEKERIGACDDWAGALVFVATATSGLSASLRPHEKEAIWKPFGEWVKKRREERREQAVVGDAE